MKGRKTNLKLLVVFSLVIMAAWLPIHAQESSFVFGVPSVYFEALNTVVALLGFVALVCTVYFQEKKQKIELSRQAYIAALSAQLNALTLILSLSEDKREKAWREIASGPRGPGKSKTIEEAIAIQIEYLDQLAQGTIDHVPTYGPKP